MPLVRCQGRFLGLVVQVSFRLCRIGTEKSAGLAARIRALLQFRCGARCTAYGLPTPKIVPDSPLITSQRLGFAMFMILAACNHTDPLETALEREIASRPLPIPVPEADRQYSAMLNKLNVDPVRKVTLHHIQMGLTEELVLLKVREQKLSSLLSEELLKTPYNRPRVRAIMKLMIENSGEASRKKLTAMLQAKEVLRQGLSPEGADNAHDASLALFLVLKPND